MGKVAFRHDLCPKEEAMLMGGCPLPGKTSCFVPLEDW